ncbi:MAG: HAMP domain-containing histidine kinase [Lachnospiraceae bacterium]|jgi:signal transduction histidine kinase|nr:HAMP domain-containing histidine kinase [Lachnospiraceae bacterium]
MILKLRRQFIIVATCSILAVLVVIIGALNIINFQVMTNRKDDILELLSNNDGRFPESMNQRKTKENKEDFLKDPPSGDFDPSHDFSSFRGLSRMEFPREMMYETRFFTVSIGSDGEVTSYDLGRIASVEEDLAKQYAQTILKKHQKGNASKGYLDDYRYLVTDTEDGYFIVFVDCATDIQSFRNTLFASVSVSFLGLVAVFILVLIFSKKVFKPVEASYQKQKRFITDASHELKTPLTIISANVEVMEMEAEESHWSQSIKKQIGRMITLVEQMVTLSRMDEQLETVRTRFSLSDALQDTAQSYLPVAESNKKELAIDIAENVFMMGDEKQIRQMTGLLLDNAMKYASVKTDSEGEKDKAGDEKPRIRLTLRQKGKKAEIVLWNTVDQIEPGDQEELFERFYRPDRSRNSKTGGSGIGLSIVKSIVEAHRGKITAVSKDGISIEFKATLPLS